MYNNGDSICAYRYKLPVTSPCNLEVEYNTGSWTMFMTKNNYIVRQLKLGNLWGMYRLIYSEIDHVCGKEEFSGINKHINYTSRPEPCRFPNEVNISLSKYNRIYRDYCVRSFLYSLYRND